MKLVITFLVDGNVSYFASHFSSIGVYNQNLNLLLLLSIKKMVNT